mgnify:CR=1 FL=1
MINPHVLQWAVIGFGLVVIVNLVQSVSLSDPQASRVIRGSPTVILCMAVGMLQSVINYGMMAFNPTFLIRTYNLSLSDFETWELAEWGHAVCVQLRFPDGKRSHKRPVGRQAHGPRCCTSRGAMLPTPLTAPRAPRAARVCRSGSLPTEYA